jgi:UDP-glucose 4-epimerase
MRILVTGASGFIGGQLVPALVERGHEVVCAVRNPAAHDAPTGATVVDVDLDQPIPRDLPAVDAVIHLAQANVGFPDGATELFRVNTVSTQELLDYARRVGIEHFFYASSGSVYGFGDRPFRETDPVVPHDFYAVTKIAAEQLIAAYGGYFSTTVFRFFAPYGPGQSGRLIPGVVDRVREGKPVTLNDGGRPRMNPLYIDNAVGAIVAALELDGQNVVNAGGDDIVDIRELAVLAGEALGRDPVFEEGDGGVAGDLIGDTGLFRERFGSGGFLAIAEGIRRVVAAGDPIETHG